MSKKTYSISELANQLQLPRTTINDWLKSFAPFLEFEMKGKRKEYNQNTLDILKNVSTWKNESKSAAAIQKLLEENYGIPAEISSIEPDDSSNIADNNTDASSVNENNTNSGEMMQIVHSDLELLLANIEKINSKRVRSVRIASWTAVIIMFLLLAGVGISAYFIYLNMLRLRQENSAAQQAYTERIAQLQTENAQKLTELRKLREIEIAELSKDFDLRNKKFQEELAQQKKDLAAALKELENSISERREAEIAKLREKFAAEQKAALEKLIAKEKELAAIQEKLNSLQQQADAIRQNSNTISQKNSDLAAELERIKHEKKILEEQKKNMESLLPQNNGAIK